MQNVGHLSNTSCTVWTAHHSLSIVSYLPTTTGLLPDRQNCGLHMHRKRRKRFPLLRLQRKPLVSGPGGCFTNVSRALQDMLSKFVYCGNRTSYENVKLKLCTCAQSHALGTRAKFQLGIITINIVSGIVYFREIILDSARNVSETTPRHASRQMCHARVVMHVGIANPWWRRKRARRSWSMRNPQIASLVRSPLYVHRWRAYSTLGSNSYKMLIDLVDLWAAPNAIPYFMKLFHYAFNNSTDRCMFWWNKLIQNLHHFCLYFCLSSVRFFSTN